jgi:hypothetical protein
LSLVKSRPVAKVDSRERAIVTSDEELDALIAEVTANSGIKVEFNSARRVLSSLKTKPLGEFGNRVKLVEYVANGWAKNKPAEFVYERIKPLFTQGKNYVISSYWYENGNIFGKKGLFDKPNEGFNFGYFNLFINDLTGVLPDVEGATYSARQVAPGSDAYTKAVDAEIGRHFDNPLKRFTERFQAWLLEYGVTQRYDLLVRAPKVTQTVFEMLLASNVNFEFIEEFDVDNVKNVTKFCDTAVAIVMAWRVNLISFAHNKGLTKIEKVETRKAYNYAFGKAVNSPAVLAATEGMTGPEKEEYYAKEVTPALQTNFRQQAVKTVAKFRKKGRKGDRERARTDKYERMYAQSGCSPGIGHGPVGLYGDYLPARLAVINELRQMFREYAGCRERDLDQFSLRVVDVFHDRWLRESEFSMVRAQTGRRGDNGRSFINELTDTLLGRIEVINSLRQKFRANGSCEEDDLCHFSYHVVSVFVSRWLRENEFEAEALKDWFSPSAWLNYAKEKINSVVTTVVKAGEDSFMLNVSRAINLATILYAYFTDNGSMMFGAAVHTPSLFVSPTAVQRLNSFCYETIISVLSRGKQWLMSIWRWLRGQGVQGLEPYELKHKDKRVVVMLSKDNVAKCNKLLALKNASPMARALVTFGKDTGGHHGCERLGILLGYPGFMPESSMSLFFEVSAILEIAAPGPQDQAQAGDDEDTDKLYPSSSVTSSIEVFANLLGVGEHLNGEVMHDITFLLRWWAFSKATNEILGDIVATIKNLVSAVCLTLFKVDPFNDTRTKYMKLTETLIKMMDDWFSKPLTSEEEALSVVDLGNDVSLCAFHIAGYGLSYAVYSAFATARSKFSAKLAQAHKMILSSKPRVRPVCVVFAGESGVGKTACMASLSQLLVRATCDRPATDLDYYAVPVGEEFWESYNSNTIVTLDEFLTIKDAQVRVRFFNLFLQMVNDGVMPVPKAALEGKGAVFFNSPYIIATTNITMLNTQQLLMEKAEAFGNRIDLWIEPRGDRTTPFAERTFLVRGGAGAAKLAKFTKANTSSTPSMIAGLPYSTITFEVKGIDIATFVYGTYVYRKQNMRPGESMESDVAGIVLDMKAKLRVEEFDFDPNVEHDVTRRSVRDTDTFNLIDVSYSDDVPVAQTLKSEGKFDLDMMIRKYCPDAVNNMVTQFFCDHPYISVFVSIIGMVTAYNLVQSFFKKKDSSDEDEEEDEDAAQGYSIKMLNRHKKEKKVIKAQNNAMRTGINDQLSQRLQADRGAIAELHIFDGSNTKPVVVMCVFVAPNVVMTVAHAILGLGSKLEFKLYDQWRMEMIKDPVMCKFIRIYQPPGKDVLLLELPACIQPHFSVGKHCSDFTGDMVGERVYLVRTDIQKSSSLVAAAEVSEEGTREYWHDQNSVEYQVNCDNVMTYALHTMAGDCGSPIYIEKDGTFLFCGIHVAGSNYRAVGYGVRVTKRDLQKWLADMGVKLVPEPPELKLGRDVAQAITLSNDLHYGLTVWGEVHPSDQHTLIAKNRINPTPWFECLGESKYKPARLRPFVNDDGKEIVPYANGVSKLRSEGHPTCLATVENRVPHADIVEEYFFKHYPVCVAPVIYSVDESINGNANMGVPGINIHTSSGYPFNLGGKSNKERYLVGETGSLEMVEELAAAVNLRLSNLKEGKRTLAIFADTLKMELRKNEKVDAGKTRYFSTCPIDFLIVFRQYMLDFIQSVQRGCVEHPVSVGINVHGMEWAAFLRRILKNCEFVADGDFENYDGSMHPVSVQFAVYLINKWYGGLGAEERNILFWEILHCFHICVRTVYTTIGCNPSGQPSTSILNSVVLIIVMISCIVILVKKYDLKLEEDPDLAGYGDDNLVAIPNFPFGELPAVIEAVYGMKLTDAGKSGVFKAQHWTKVTYLSRSFRVEGGLVHAPLNLDRIASIIYYTKDTHLITLQSTLDAFCLELTHHGRDMFEKWTKIVREHAYTRSRLLRVLTYGEAIKRRFALRFGQDVAQSKKVQDISVADFDGEIYSDTEGLETRDLASTVVAHEREQVAFGELVPDDITHEPGVAIGRTLDNGLETTDYNHVLNRMYPVTTGTWNASSTGVLYTSELFSMLSTLPNISRCFDAFRFFRCSKIRITIRLNAQRLNYGRLIGAYTLAQNFVATDPLTLTTYPHHLVSATTNEVESFEIPFVVPFVAIDVLNPSVWGYFTLAVFNPLSACTAESGVTAQYAVYAQFIEPEVYGIIPTAYPMIERNMRAQAKGINKEAVKKKTGGDQTVSSAPTEVHKGGIYDLPIIGTVVRIGDAVVTGAGKIMTSGLASGLATAVLGMFGLEKPVDVDAITRVSNVLAPDFTNCDVLDYSTPGGFKLNSKVDVLPNIGPFESDEMSIGYIKRIPSCCAQFTLTASGNATIPVNPCYTTNVTLNMPTPPNTWSPTILGALTSRFTFWRGTLRYTFYVTTCAFMTGRLRVRYAPASTIAGAAYSDDVCTRIIDLQTETEFCIEVPFVTNQIFATVHAFDMMQGNTNFDTSMGIIYIDWINPLVCPDPTLNPGVYINVYISGGDDFDLAVPNSYQFLADVPPTNKVSSKTSDNGVISKKHMRAQVAPRDNNVKVESIVPNSRYTMEAGVVIGERISSVRELLKRYMPVGTAQFSNPTGPGTIAIPASLTFTGPSVDFTPHYSNHINVLFTEDEMYSWQKMYNMQRGSFRIKIEMPHSGTNGSNAVVSILPYQAYISGFSFMRPPLRMPLVETIDKYRPMLDIQIPYWETASYINTGTNYSTQAVAVFYDGNFGTSTDTMRLNVYSSIGDDFSYGFLHGPGVVQAVGTTGADDNFTSFFL